MLLIITLMRNEVYYKKRCRVAAYSNKANYLDTRMYMKPSMTEATIFLPIISPDLLTSCHYSSL